MESNNYSLDDKFSIKEITDLNKFRELRTVWDELAKKQGPFAPFLSFGWFKIWLDHFLKDNRLLILLLHKGEKILGIAPFLIKKEKFKGVKIRKIELIGNIYSPIRYFLFDESDNGERIKNASFIFKYFSKNYRNWDIADLSGIPEENFSFDILKKSIKEIGCSSSDYFCYANWYLDGINYSGEEYLRRRPGNIRENVPYRMRRLKRIGELEFKMIKEYGDIDKYMDIYYDLYSKSWQEKEEIGPTFHRDLAKMTARNGWLRLGFLFLDGCPMAGQLWICANECAYILKLFYDQKYEKYAPGKILTAEMIKYVIDFDKVKTIDYVHGDESYKKDWMPKRRERKGVLIFNNNLKGQYLAFVMNKIQPAFNKNRYLRTTKEIIKRYLRLTHQPG